MLIRELEMKSGLDRATIRFYEKEGFLTPQRQENGYREYSEDDLEQLLKIKLLRRLGVSLDTVRKLQQGSADFTQTMEEQICILKQQQKETEQSIRICLQISEDRPTYQTLNASYYLEKFNQPLKQQVKTPVFAERVYREYHPFRRYLARTADYTIASTFLCFVFIVVFRVRPFTDLLLFLITFGAPFLMVPINAALLQKFGTTLGKWLFGVHVYSENGCTLSYSEALEREWEVIRAGYGYGIPVWQLYCLIRSYRTYRDGDLWWDEACEFRYENWTNQKKAILACAIGIVILARVGYSCDQMMPKYRGDMTVGKFANNYNFYTKLYNQNPDETSMLQPDGSWWPADHGVAYIYPEKTDKENPDFTYELSDGIISKISYTNTWTNIVYLTPLTQKCQLAAITAVMSQKGMNLADLTAFAAALSAADLLHNDEVTYENVRIQWTVDTENCKPVTDREYMADDTSEESKITVHFDIQID